jgi:hypothetical protein
MKEEKLSNAMENFKIEELEPRLEMGKWSAGSGSTYATDPDGNYIQIVEVTHTITF